MTPVDIHLIAAWSDLVLDDAGPFMLMCGLRPTEEERAALGRGFAAIRSAVLGEQVQDGLRSGVTVPDHLTDYLLGIAAGIEATGADRDPMSLVAGLVAGAARLQFGRAGNAGEAPSAAEVAARAGVAAADLATDGADLCRVVAAAAGVAASGWTAIPAPDGPAQADDRRLRSFITMLLAALEDAVGRQQDRPGRASCGAGAGDHRGRPFLAEMTFEFRGGPSAQARLSDMIDRMGTDLRIWPDDDSPAVTRYHLHTNRPAEVTAEIYALGTPFDLRIGSLEPPMSERGGTMDAAFHDREGRDQRRADFDAR
jgi:hypothetical protein